MKNAKLTLIIGAIFLLLLNIQCDKDILDPDLSVQKELMKSTNAAKPDGETAGNNLSFPVIWSDRYSKLAEPAPGVTSLDGEWWYVWGDDPIDPNVPYDGSCLPNPADPSLCLNGEEPGDGSSTVYKAYLQKDANNIWEAGQIFPPEGTSTYVDWIDWGDNLESVNWTINSQVRTEVVLLEDLPTPALELAMKYVSGWGISEVHGMQAETNNTPVYGDGTQATVYSHNARFTIQKINVEDAANLPALGEATWVPKEGWTDDEDIFNQPIFNNAVYEAADGPGYYSAEINVKGKVIYGYTWNLKKLNDGPGYYRLTFSFDPDGGLADLDTYFDLNTEIVVPVEEIAALAEETGGGGTPYIDVANNLTYIDVLITERQRGAGGGNGGGKTNNPGGGEGGGKDGNIGNGTGGSGSGSGNGRH